MGKKAEIPEPALPPPAPPVPPECPTYEEKTARYQVLMENRKALFGSLVEVSGRFTQWSLTLAGGGLALSMTYVEKLQPETSAGKYWLVGSWGLLSLSLLSSLLSLHYSTKSTKAAITQADEEYRAWEEGKSKIACLEPGRCVRATDRLARCSMWMFGLGIMAMAIFVLICPPTEKKERDKQTTVTVSLPAAAKLEPQDQISPNNKDHVKATTPDTSTNPPDTGIKP